MYHQEEYPPWRHLRMPVHAEEEPVWNFPSAAHFQVAYIQKVCIYEYDLTEIVRVTSRDHLLSHAPPINTNEGGRQH